MFIFQRELLVDDVNEYFRVLGFRFWGAITAAQLQEQPPGSSSGLNVIVSWSLFKLIKLTLHGASSRISPESLVPHSLCISIVYSLSLVVNLMVQFSWNEEVFLYILCDSAFYYDSCWERINQEAKYVIFSFFFWHSYNATFGDDQKKNTTQICLPNFPKLLFGFYQGMYMI